MSQFFPQTPQSMFYTLSIDPNPLNSPNSYDKEEAMEEKSELALEVEQSLADGSEDCGRNL